MQCLGAKAVTAECRRERVDLGACATEDQCKRWRLEVEDATERRDFLRARHEVGNLSNLGS